MFEVELSGRQEDRLKLVIEAAQKVLAGGYFPVIFTPGLSKLEIQVLRDTFKIDRDDFGGVAGLKHTFVFNSPLREKEVMIIASQRAATSMMLKEVSKSPVWIDIAADGPADNGIEVFGGVLQEGLASRDSAAFTMLSDVWKILQLHSDDHPFSRPGGAAKLDFEINKGWVASMGNFEGVGYDRLDAVQELHTKFRQWWEKAVARKSKEAETTSASSCEQAVRPSSNEPRPPQGNPGYLVQPRRL